MRNIHTETQAFELKSAAKGCPAHLYNTLSSFSNQDEGGTILFGVDEQSGYAEAGIYDARDLELIPKSCVRRLRR